jgi:colanic acid biosynthesis glycosyl transferase WcaI
MRSVLLLTHYYAPEVGAAQTRLRETVGELRDLGWRVTVVAPIPHYPLGVVPTGYRWWRPRREVIDGTPVVRLPVLARGGDRFFDRLASQASFALASAAATALARRHDVLLIESPPLFLAGAGRVVATIADRPYVLHVADPWPDFPIAMGYLDSKIAQRLAYALERFAYRRAKAITTVTPTLVGMLSAKSGAHGKVHHLPNAVDVERFGNSMTRAEARRKMGWDPNRFTVVYAGTVGKAQGLRTLIDAAAQVGDTASIHVIGDGVERDELDAAAAASGARALTFHRAMPRDAIPVALAAADAALVMLRDGPLYEASLPTKLVEAMAAGRAVVVAARGLSASIVGSAGAGYVAEPENATDLARAIGEAAVDPERDVRGDRGRAVVTESYDRAVVVRHLSDLLERAAAT